MLSRSVIQDYLRQSLETMDTLRNRDPIYLADVAKQDAQKYLCHFIAYTAFVLRRTHSTCRGRLCAIVWHHKMAGLDDPTRDCPTLRLLMQGVKRTGKPPKKKTPVTFQMLELACSSLTSNTPPQVAMKVALTLGLFFMTRRSEYTADNSGTFHPDYAIRFRDIVFMNGNTPCTWRDRATGVAVYIKRSKNDVAGQGCWRYSDRSGHRTVCPVLALHTWCELNLHTNPNKPPASWESSVCSYQVGDSTTRVITGDQLSRFLKAVATASGVPPEVSSHSLRAGGASALIAAKIPVWMLKLLGHWSSDAVLIYIHESLESMKGLAEKMARRCMILPNFFTTPPGESNSYVSKPKTMGQ